MTQRTSLPLLALGSSYKLWLPTLLSNFQPLSEAPLTDETFDKALGNPAWSDQSWKNSRSEKEALEQLKKEQSGKKESSGSVLLQLQGWSIPLNDAFILAGLSVKKEFHIAIPNRSVDKFPIDELFDTINNRPRVLGRELCILSLLGCKRADHPHAALGTVFLPEYNLPHDIEDVLKTMESVTTKDDVIEVTKEMEKKSETFVV